MNSFLLIKDKETAAPICCRSINPKNEGLIVSRIVSILKSENIIEYYFDNLTDFFGIEIIYTEGNDENLLHLSANLSDKEKIKEITNLLTR